MENEILKAIVNNRAWVVMFVWLLFDTRKESKAREEKLQQIINKNQEVIWELAENFNVVENIQQDVADIKSKLDKVGEYMSKFVDKLINLFEVKKIIALMIITVFCILSVKRIIGKEQFTTVAIMIVSFYFGQSTVKGTIKQATGSDNDEGASK